MNQLFPFVEEAFRAGSTQAILRLLDELANQPGDKSDQFGLPANWEYVLKRLLGAVLARQPTLKFNAFLAISALGPHLAAVHTQSLLEYFSALSDYKKHCESKPIEIEAYVIGKILGFKALKNVFTGNLNAIGHLSTLMTAFPAYEEQIVQLLSQLATDKKSKNAFAKLSPTTKAGFVLHTLLAAQLKGTTAELNQNVVVDVIAELQPLYPKRSICLDYLAPQLKIFLDAPAEFLSEQLAALFQGEELNVRTLFYLLQLIQGHLKGVTITSENVWHLLSVQVLGGWILQLKVKNKHIRKIAEGITLNFQPDPQLAFTLLSKLHEKQLYLQNINHKHPLYSLYLHVEPHHYAKYLLGLISQIGNQEDQKVTHYNQLQVFLVARHKELTVEQICQIITIFVNKYQQSSDQKALQAINTIFNALLPSNPKKTQVLHTRASLILAKLPFDQLELGEQQADVKQAVKQIRSRFKANDEEKDPFNVAFLNFLLSTAFYCLIFPQEVEVFADLEVVEKELRANVLFCESGLNSKKKRKGENEKNKPVHVLVEIFISLLTKSSQFLRTPINILFEHIVPFLDTSDIAIMLQVITKPESELLNAQQ